MVVAWGAMRMAEYIEREVAVKCLCEVYDGFSVMTPSYYNGFMNAVYHVKNTVPAADVVPVVHGRWEDYYFIKADCPKDGFPSVRCSVCGITFCDIINVHSYMYHYCPNCGARMDGE